MIKSIFKPLSFRKPASFEYHGSVDEGLYLLSKHIKKSTLYARLKDALVGKATTSEVKIWRYRPWGNNGFVPVFIGKFVRSNSTTNLEGEFRLHKGSRIIFIASFIGIIVFWAAVAVRDIDKTSSASDITLFVQATIASIIFIIIVLHVSYRFAKKDLEFVEDSIKKILLSTEKNKGSVLDMDKNKSN